MRIFVIWTCSLFLVSPLASHAALIGPSESGYTQIYGLDIPNSTNLHASIPYSLDIANTIVDGSFSRIAYHMELQRPGGPLNYVWVSVDAFTNDASQTGVPSFAGGGTVFQQQLTNMNIFSNPGSGIVTGTGLATGNIEFWPFNYGTSNAAGVPNASNSVYDTGDFHTGGNSYGSMQIHNHASGVNQTLFALNRFGGSHDVGIGNQSGGHPDWTFAGNANQYSVKTLEVWVDGQLATVPEPTTSTVWSLLGLCAAGGALRRRRKRNAA